MKAGGAGLGITNNSLMLYIVICVFNMVYRSDKASGEELYPKVQ